MIKSRPVLCLLLICVLAVIAIQPARADTSTPITPGNSSGCVAANYLVASMFSTGATAPTLTALGVKLSTALSAGDRIVLGVYSDNSNYPGTLVVKTNEITSGAVGWVTGITQSSVQLSATTNYWLAIIANVGFKVSCDSGGTSRYYSLAYSSNLPAAFSGSSSPQGVTYALEYVWTSGPSPNDFSITASPSAQNIGTGSTASYTLTVQYGSGFSSTVTLAVTSGCPAGVTCSVNPSSLTSSGAATLNVPTLITTPSGTTSVTVTASSTSPTLSHTVTVQLTVTGAGSYSANVHAGATQVVVTVTWTGAGPASVTLAGPGGTPTLSESGQVVYDRMTFTSGSTTATNIHRVTLNISANSPGSPQTWTVYVSLSVSYTVTIEVS